MMLRKLLYPWLFIILSLVIGVSSIQGQESESADAETSVEVVEGIAEVRVTEVTEGGKMSLDEKIDYAFQETTGWFVAGIFSTIPIAGYDVMWVVIWLGGAGLVLTIAFGFINLRAFPLAVRTVKGKYSSEDDPGEITHFQALTTAVSGTVGLGNIAGVAIGVSMAGPGVAFWLFISGFLGMATKFAECTLGMKYRKIDEDGHINGGGMQYLKKGFAEKGLKPVGTVLAVLFAIFCIFASFGGGNVFQVNQVTAQLLNVTGGTESYFADKLWVLGVIIAVLTGAVIIGGIHSIANVTSRLVPMMCVVYIVSALVVLTVNVSHIPAALQLIVVEAFTPRAAVGGGFLAVFIWGIRRATFSNEAGLGSAPIAHSAAKSRMPASEGVVALLEPFIDTVIVCTLTSLVLVTTMNFDGETGRFLINNQEFLIGDDSNNSTTFGIGLTSASFETVHSGFKYVLFVCVLLFALSTLISWSYYGLQAWEYLFGKSKISGLIYKLIFCGIIIAGASASMSNAITFSDASMFAMSIPNLIGVYFLMPVVTRELKRFQAFAKHVDNGDTLDEAEAKVLSE